MNVLPSRCRKYLIEGGIVFDEVESPQKAVILRGYTVPKNRFDADAADILILLPGGYPDVHPDMFYALPWLKLASCNRYPNAADQSLDFNGQSWQRWSRHNEQWRPGVDGIWTMLRRIDTALERAA